MVPSEFMNGLPIDISNPQDQNSFNSLNVTEAFFPGNSVTPSPPNSAGNRTTSTSNLPLGCTTQGQNTHNIDFLSQQTNSLANNLAQHQIQQNQQHHSNLLGAMDNDLVTTVRANLSKLEELRKEIEAQAKQINLGNYSITSIKSSTEFAVTGSNGMGMNGAMGVRDISALSSGDNNNFKGGNSNFPQAAFNMRNGNVPGMGINFVGTNNMMQNNGQGMMPNGMNFLNGQGNSLPFGNGGANIGNSMGTGDDPDSETRNSSGPRVSFHENLINAPEASAASRASFLERNGRRMDLSWHSDEHLPLRREVVKFIAQLLAARKSNPTRKWLSELPYKARKLEERLYRSADSIEDYLNKKTLKERLKKVATEITCKYRDAKRQTSQDKMNRTSGDIGDLFGANNSQNGQGQANQGPNDSIAQLSAHLQSGFRRTSGQANNFQLPNNQNPQASQGVQRNLSIGGNEQNSNNLQEQLLMSMRSQQMSALWNSNLNPALNNSNNNNNNQNDSNKQQQFLLQQQQFLQQQQMLLQAQNRVGSANSVGGNLPNVQSAASNSMNNNNTNGGTQASQNTGNMNKLNNLGSNQQGPSAAAGNLNSAHSMQQLSALFNNNPQMQQNNSNNNNSNNNTTNNNNNSNNNSNNDRNSSSGSPLPIDTDMFASEADTADFLDVPQDFDWLE